ncbi:hypothetical protein [Longispora fulva]|uniref:Uncharacterized protein n=1 Tax=Longispora fulva TaxID=619741 RepID=A0A8J7GP75_9ACTN|nr:hypothetical protein [Longispora fulva]MBG6136364.1 hypothetical protein [Longispora fulva]
MAELFMAAMDKGPPPPCDSDLACLPDLGPLIRAAFVGLVVVALVGPLVARVLRLRTPWMFAAPVGVMVCVMFSNSVLPLLLIWSSYAPLAVWVMRRRPVGVWWDDRDSTSSAPRRSRSM